MMYTASARVWQLAAETTPYSGPSELGAALLQLVVTLALAALCAKLHRLYGKPFYAWWGIAWGLYVLRLGAILTFLISRDWFALYWHQVLTGWTALAVLATAVVFARGGGVRWWFIAAAAFPPLWSYIAIYRLDTFLWAALPAVLFLSGATLATGVVFWRYARRVRSLGATVLATAFVLWGLHHLDYPFLRERGAWVPWGYYLDIVFELAVGAGILLLVADDLRRGLDAMTALSGELQHATARDRPALVDALLARPLALPAVRGAALYVVARQTYERGAGACAAWQDRAPGPAEQSALAQAHTSGHATIHPAWAGPGNSAVHRFAALLPIPRHDVPADAATLVIVGDARTPFAVLDESFLTALGQQIGSALTNAALTERLRQRTADLERLSARMVAQHEEERRRLSRELHDETAQVLSALKLELEMLRRVLPPGEHHRIDDAMVLVDTGIRSIRAVTNELRPALLEDLGLVPAMRSLIAEFVQRTHIDVHFSPPPDGELAALGGLTAEAELALFRALQEALANVARHAGARRVDVALAASHEHDVTLSVADDGVGFDAAHARTNGGMGLAGMRERVAALGGAVTIARTEPGESGRGTTLHITLRGSAP